MPAGEYQNQEKTNLSVFGGLRVFISYNHLLDDVERSKCSFGGIILC